MEILKRVCITAQGFGARKAAVQSAMQQIQASLQSRAILTNPTVGNQVAFNFLQPWAAPTPPAQFPNYPGSLDPQIFAWTTELQGNLDDGRNFLPAYNRDKQGAFNHIYSLTNERLTALQEWLRLATVTNPANLIAATASLPIYVGVGVRKTNLNPATISQLDSAITAGTTISVQALLNGTRQQNDPRCSARRPEFVCH